MSPARSFQRVYLIANWSIDIMELDMEELHGLKFPVYVAVPIYLVFHIVDKGHYHQNCYSWFVRRLTADSDHY